MNYLDTTQQNKPMQIENEIIPSMDTSGVRITFDGERESIQDNFSVVGYLALAAIFIIYIILLVQFNFVYATSGYIINSTTLLDWICCRTLCF